MPSPEDQEKKNRDKGWREVIEKARRPSRSTTEESRDNDQLTPKKSVRELIDEKTFDDVPKK